MINAGFQECDDQRSPTEQGFLGSCFNSSLVPQFALIEQVTPCPLLAQSGHGVLHCKSPLFEPKRTPSLEKTRNNPCAHFVIR